MSIWPLSAAPSSRRHRTWHRGHSYHTNLVCTTCRLTCEVPSFSQSGTIKKITPSNAPGNVAPLITMISMRRKGRVAVTYTTWNNSKCSRLEYTRYNVQCRSLSFYIEHLHEEVTRCSNSPRFEQVHLNLFQGIVISWFKHMHQKYTSHHYSMLCKGHVITE